MRPTTDMAKESLFNILTFRVDFSESSVLDLFAGTGNISMEFASRGARDVVAVELNNRCTDYISKASQEIGLKNIYVIKANVFNYIKSVRRKFDIIFADPPYGLPEGNTIPEMIFSHELLNEEGLLIMEHDSSLNFSDHRYFQEEREYGKVHFSFFTLPVKGV